ncbi:MAG: Sensor histidine kinase TmoS [Pseudomonadota bacterium]
MDTRTLYLVLGIIFLAVPFGSYLVLRPIQSRETITWNLSWFCLGLAMVLVGLRGQLPDFISFFIAHGLLAVSYVLRLWAALLVKGLAHGALRRALSIRVTVGVVYLSVFTGLLLSEAPDQIRLTFVFGAQALGFFDLGLVSRRQHSTERTSGQRLFSFMALFIACAISVRAFDAYAYPLNSVFSSSPNQALFLIGVLTGFILCNMGFVQIQLERLWQTTRSIREELQSSIEIGRQLRESIQEKASLLSENSKWGGLSVSGALLGSLSHELSQPATALLANASLLDQGGAKLDPHRLSAVCKEIQRDSQRIRDGLLGLRGLFGRSDNVVSTWPLRDLVLEITDWIEDRADQMSVDVFIENDGQACVIADKGLMRSALLNLVTNALDALEYVEGPRALYLRSAPQGDTAVLTIEDNGPGLKPEKQDKPFELFKSAKRDGSGMGLWLTRMIVESQRGSIRYQSAKPSGAMFEIRLPVAAATSAT